MCKLFAVVLCRASVLVTQRFTLRISAAVLLWMSVSAKGQVAGLVAEYGFNEGTGSSVTDTSGNGNDGTISGATWTTSGKYSGALVFNGTSALVTINDAASLDVTTGMTIEAWVKPSVVNSAWRDIIYKGNDNYYLEGTSGNGGLPAMGGTLGGSDVALYGTGVLPANTWTHLAATYNGTTMRLYVNGVQMASQAQTGAIATSINPLQIGGDSLYGQFFQGTIDEVRIYNVALTGAQIQTDMNTPVLPDMQPPSAPANLAATAIGGTQIVLNWTASTDDVGVTGYLLERQDPGNANFVQIATVPGTNYFDAGLVAHTNYSYRVRATDGVGNLSGYSPVASATTLTNAVASDNFNRPNGPLGANWSKPIVSTNNLVVTNDQAGVDVEDNHIFGFWSANNFSNDQYSQISLSSIGAWTGVILRGDAALDPVWTTPPSGSQFYIGFVFAPNDYRIYHFINNGYYSESVGSTETWHTNDVLKLEISGSVEPLVTMYRNGKPVLVWLVADGADVKNGGSPGIGIYSPAGKHLTADNWEGGDLTPDTNAPTAPAGLVASPVTSSQIDLSWTSSTDDIGVVAYKIERSQGAGSTNFFLLDLTIGTNYSDANLSTRYVLYTTNSSILQPGTTYNYRVWAMDAAGNLSGQPGVATASTPAVPTGSLTAVAAYGFNEGTGTMVADLSGNGNNGTISGATWTNSGKYGKALGFNGTNALVTVSNSISLQLNAAMTLEAWVNPAPGTNAFRDVIYKGNDNYYLEATSPTAGEPAGGGTFGSTDVPIYGLTALATNTWSHLAVTYDGGTLRLYVNGTQVANRLQPGAIATSTNALQMGGDTLYSQYFKGMLDEVRIYNRALSAAEIQTDMNTPVSYTGPLRIDSIVQQGNDMLITWKTVGVKTNVLQAANGDGGGGLSNNFNDIFTVTNLVSTVTNYLDVGAATNFPTRYYRVRLLP